MSNLIQVKVKIPGQLLQKLFNIHYCKKFYLIVALNFVFFPPLVIQSYTFHFYFYG